VKLVIQIPCLNEETVLPVTLAALPRKLEGFDRVEWLVIDDGSTDRTAEVARASGVDHIVRFSSNKGLAVAFQSGIEAALKLGAGVIVNTDGDNQYPASEIPRLVAPLLAGQADIVVGTRVIKEHAEFSLAKKIFQRLGSWVVRQASNTDVPDTTSGFRAYSREAALRLNVLSGFTYTLETLIQAGKSDLAVAHIPIRTNPRTRESRLFRSIPHYVARSIGTIIRIYAMHEPLRVFLRLAAVVALAGTALVARFTYFYLTEPGPTGHVQTLVVGDGLLTFALQLAMLGIIGDLLRANRLIDERTLYRVRKIELALGVVPDNPPDEEVATGMGKREPID
jgi:glycosyltransferase involved in cell wall biosynthesis